jgi:hypothetical protein
MRTRNPNKRQRKTLKKEFPAVKIVGAKGKLIYASQARRTERRRAEYSADNGFWADYEPRRDTGVFANTHCSTYTHNGITKYL